jgi:hypothetical protein
MTQQKPVVTPTLTPAVTVVPTNQKMTPAEVEGYMSKIEAGVRMAEPERTEYINRLRAWALADDGKEFYMVNLLSFYDIAQPTEGVETPLLTVNTSGIESNQIYLKTTVPLTSPLGVVQTFGGDAQGLGTINKTNILGYYPGGFDKWSQVNINYYPSRRAFMEMASNPDYLVAEPYKTAGSRLIVFPASKR